MPLLIADADDITLLLVSNISADHSKLVEIIEVEMYSFNCEKNIDDTAMEDEIDNDQTLTMSYIIKLSNVAV